MPHGGLGRSVEPSGFATKQAAYLVINRVMYAVRNIVF
jgi:hypothetical protein